MFAEAPCTHLEKNFSSDYDARHGDERRRKKKRKEGKLLQEKAFYFFTSVGNYTGENAASLEEFAKVTIAETLGDKELAEQIKDLKR